MGEQYGRPLKVVPSQRALDVKIDQNMEDFILAREVSVFSNTKKFPFLFVESALNAFFGVVDTNVAGMIKSYSIEDKFGYITRLDGEGDVYVTEKEIKDFKIPGVFVLFDITRQDNNNLHATFLRELRLEE